MNHLSNETTSTGQLSLEETKARQELEDLNCKVRQILARMTQIENGEAEGTYPEEATDLRATLDAARDQMDEICSKH